MNIRHPVLFVVLAIIGIGMLNSLFNEPPPIDPVVAAKETETRQREEQEKLRFNAAHCEKNGLVYAKDIDSSKGECVTRGEQMKIGMENARKLEDAQKASATRGLK